MRNRRVKVIDEPDKWPDGRVKWSSYDFPCVYCGDRLGGEVSMWRSETKGGVLRGTGWYHERCAVKHRAPIDVMGPIRIRK